MYNLTSFLVLLILALGLLAWASFDMRLQFFLPARYKGNYKNKTISLTFDDGPTPFTLQVLNILAKHNCKATFFCIGKQIEQYPEIAKQIVKQGHILANHTYSHTAKMGFLSTQNVYNEIHSNQQVIINQIGVKPNWFRPPFGVTNPAIAKAIKKNKLVCIGWNIRSLDTISKTSEEVFNRVKRKLKPGGIILLHDTSNQTVEALEQLLLEIKKQQLTVVPLNELLDLDAYKNE
ncbi:polysaccharide deacetylase family protein [Flavobacterium agricola]|uniref:Polysaccharide deacetylase family protein n=1 Tax=Flavobacterium agricola TaxID=2870839 RepID=A0ABY6LXT9_9FLAO|nr:polysaccharide deacetylase family protein [Flavobacterium agricola]UYW00991.1 polysaccharide deacetylase family protein [Flavobacterium agricola]